MKITKVWAVYMFVIFVKLINFFLYLNPYGMICQSQ